MHSRPAGPVCRHGPTVSVPELHFYSAVPSSCVFSGTSLRVTVGVCDTAAATCTFFLCAGQTHRPSRLNNGPDPRQFSCDLVLQKQLGSLRAMEHGGRGTRAPFQVPGNLNFQELAGRGWPGTSPPGAVPFNDTPVPAPASGVPWERKSLAPNAELLAPHYSH
jgi:hypothetical protein